MADDVAYPPCPSNEVVVYTVKGNLAHRIDKLGTEKAVELLSPDQRILRELAYHSFALFPDIKYGIHEPRMPHYERPEWLGGAFMYLKEEHVCRIKDVLQWTWSQYSCGQSKYVLVSAEYIDVLKRVLGAELVPPHQDHTEVPGRTRFLYTRAGCTKDGVRLNMGRYLTLPSTIFEESRSDEGVMEYLAAPVSVQMMEPRGWDMAMRVIADQNPAYIEFNMGEPYCRLCGVHFSVPHVCTVECSQKRNNASEPPSALFQVLIDAALLLVEQRVVTWKWEQPVANP